MESMKSLRDGNLATTSAEDRGGQDASDVVELVNTPASSIVAGRSWKLALLHATTAD
jgi:hypothetical protein